MFNCAQDYCFYEDFFLTIFNSGLKLWKRSEATSQTEKFAFSRNNAEKRACDSKIRTFYYGNKNRCGILEVKKRFVAERLDELDDKTLPGKPLTQVSNVFLSEIRAF